MPRSSKPDAALGAAVRHMREIKGVTREALAYEAGITTGSLARIELAQSSPRWSTVCLIAEALDLSLVELVKAMEAAGSSAKTGAR